MGWRGWYKTSNQKTQTGGGQDEGDGGVDGSSLGVPSSIHVVGTGFVHALGASGVYFLGRLEKQHVPNRCCVVMLQAVLCSQQ